MLVGARAILVGVRRLPRAPISGKLHGAGSIGTIVFLHAIEPFLGVVTLIVYVIVLLISLVA